MNEYSNKGQNKFYKASLDLFCKLPFYKWAQMYLTNPCKYTSHQIRNGIKVEGNKCIVLFSSVY